MIERNNFSVGIRNLGLRTSSVIVFLALVANGEHRHGVIALYLEQDDVAAEPMERPVRSEATEGTRFSWDRMRCNCDAIYPSFFDVLKSTQIWDADSRIIRRKVLGVARHQEQRMRIGGRPDYRVRQFDPVVLS